MYEIDFLPVGDGERSGDAIALRFTRPEVDGQVVVVVDAGFQDDGEALVEHVSRWYGTQYVDLVISTHPDGDHIGGLGIVMRELAVGELWIHRPSLHGHPGNSSADPAEKLVALAAAQSAPVQEPFAGVGAFGDRLVVAGPTIPFYEQMLDEQTLTTKAAAPSAGRRLAEAATQVARRALDRLPVETLIDDAGGTNPRNNSTTVLDLQLEGRRFLLTSDAGAPALQGAADTLDALGRSTASITFMQCPHHGSRHNLDRATLDRLLGTAGQGAWRTSCVSVSRDSDNPAPKITNALMRRGCRVGTTEGRTICYGSADAPSRPGWGPITPLPPRDESE